MELTFEPTLDDYTALSRHMLRIPEYRKLVATKAILRTMFLPSCRNTT